MEDLITCDLGELAVDLSEAPNVDENKVDIVDLDYAAPEMVLEALNGIPLFVNDYVVFELRVKAILALLDMQSGIQAYFKNRITEIIFRGFHIEVS